MRDIIFIGDGLGVRTFPAKCLGLNVLGTDTSKWAIEHSYCKDSMIIDDISNTQITEMAKLLVVYDILEHLDNNQLDRALENISKLAKNFVISVPYIGDPNLLADKTHKQFMTKQQWIDKIQEFGIIVKDAPKEWLFANQILIGGKE